MQICFFSQVCFQEIKGTQLIVHLCIFWIVGFCFVVMVLGLFMGSIESIRKSDKNNLLLLRKTKIVWRF